MNWTKDIIIKHKMQFPTQQLPTIPPPEQFYEKKTSKKQQLKEIDQIQSFNSRQGESLEQAPNTGGQFDEASWRVKDQPRKQDLFLEEGKGLISDELSIKTLGFIQLLWGLLAESIIITLSALSSSPIWLYFPNIIVTCAQLFYLFSHCLSIVTFLNHKHNEPKFIQKTHRILQLVFYVLSWVNILRACRLAYSLYFDLSILEGMQLGLSLIAAYIEYELFKHAKSLSWQVSELKKGQLQPQSDFSVIQ